MLALLMQPSIVPNPGANMADGKGCADLFHDHGFIDMQEFGRVSARVAALERTLHTVNTNLTSMSTLFNQFMSHFASLSESAPSGGITLVVTPPLVPTPPVESVAPSATQEGAMLKNMKPHVFKGEERERNKNAIHTILHKWMDLHCLRHTLPLRSWQLKLVSLLKVKPTSGG